MYTYRITIRVKGDHISPDFEDGGDYEVSSLDELAVEAWEPFRRAMHYVWKDMESGIFMEPRPNSLMSIECYKGAALVDEMKVFDAYFKIRREKAMEITSRFNAPVV